MAKLLVIDNYDSFTFNLVQMFLQYPLEIEVHRSDRITMKTVQEMNPDYILISPGPKWPGHTGISMPLIETYFKKVPILGVCLGMQCINEVFGGKTIRAPVPMHGKTSEIRHEKMTIFKDIPSPFKVARYHSLMTRMGNSDLFITAKCDDGAIMGLSHPEYPLHGVQFHPESFLTEHGFTIIENFLELGSLKDFKRHGKD
ncbi:MAG: aminodeoxychorismate/anthranilate synthase component II [Desulfobacterales bacterium]|nr:aminodeoxychorismate/anthranilate synthase component II [Desulfobacterales bacterium]